MRDYPNGGFFFIDAAPIIAAGARGLKIEGIYEDAKRAIEGGKVFVLTGVTVNGTTISGIVLPAVEKIGMSIEGGFTELSLMFQITNEDVVIINIGG